MFGNDRRWIMLPIRKHDGVEIVQGGFSFKLETPRKPARGPITLREAIQLVDEEIKAAKKREEMEAFRKLLQELGSRPTTPEHLQALMKIADERDKERAVSAINWLSNFQATPELIAFLNKKSKDPDPRIALEAAIVTTYSGDWSGFDIILGFASNKDPKLRSDAIAQLGAIRFRRYAKRIVPLLLERLRVEKDPEVLDWTIEALGNYPSQLALDAIRPFEKHEDPRVSLRATGVNQTITQELRKKDN
jgi:HEAT repeat protein